MDGTTQVVHPGPSKEIWDAALIRSGLNPADVSEYNTSGGGRAFDGQSDGDTPAEQ
jgi:hypothetical protein